MADLVITPGDVVRGSNSSTTSGISGGTITAGMAVYLQSSTNTYLPAQANNVNTTTVGGIALNSADINQPILILTAGDIVIGGTPVRGGTYMLAADNPGAIAPVADLTTGNYVSFLGVATSTTDLFIQILNSGITHA